MNNENYLGYVYTPNSVPHVKEEMMQEIGIKNVDELYEEIPEELRFRGKMNIPAPLTSEYELKRHMNEILSKNITSEEYISFLGGGCYNHYVPAICDEVNHRSEFLTAYAGEPYEDYGRFQVLFEYESLMAELLDIDVVNVPTYDWCQAASTSARMAIRMTGRKEIIVAKNIGPQRMKAITNYCLPDYKVTTVDYDKKTGRVCLDDLKSKISANTAGVYVENPSYFGVIDDQGEEIANIVHDKGAVFIVGVDPISLGVLETPSNYDADLICGDIQSLGIHMQYGGGHAGFIGARDDERYIQEYPFRLFGILPKNEQGEYGFGDVAYERTSFALREKGKEFVGTMSALWGITAGVYLSLMGPTGMYEIGKTIIQKTQYAVKKMSEIEGVKVGFNGASFKEFVVNFDATSKTVKEINDELLKNKIFGGIDLSNDFKELGQSALYCVTEVISKNDIDKMVETLKKILSR